MTRISSQGPVETSPYTQPLVENVQALRGIAALLVVWAHLKFPMAALCPIAKDYPLVQSGFGGIGVDLFFTISGYVISLTACKRHHSALDFLLARVARVAPLYYVMSALAYVILFLSTSEHIPNRAIWNAYFFLPIFDFQSATEGYTQPLVGVGWTLSFEMWFYLVFAGLLVFWKPIRVAFLLPCIFFAGASVMTLYHGHWFFPRFIFHPFVTEFAFGCVIYNTQKWFSRWVSWLLLLGGGTYLLVLSRDSGYLGWHMPLLSTRIDLAWLRIFLWGVPSALIMAGLVGLERTHGFQLPRFLIWMGGISYSLYLSHTFTMQLIENIGPSIGLRNSVAIAIAVFAACILFAWLCWKWIEHPLTTLAQSWAKKATRPTRSLNA